ncbi:putative DNA-directed RNA polymerase III subunit RPC10 [Paratrimastix pyriformis]|uniref:DNA-directed RNA polymerase subunit n=1 Tax=Paratrimastix pyriformis TaxID=342808 RepID=A0ABQ8UQ36_9EUKA|nr:putative DNA-directed RNA polymerase III subunit RPC10 [Paratrimastix pyriformis]
MSRFCPNCAQMLMLDAGTGATIRFFCPTCPYVFPITGKLTSSLPLQKKRVDDVLGDVDPSKCVTTDLVPCPRCRHKTSFFYEIQTRSADEPATIFHRCVKCGLNWKTN